MRFSTTAFLLAFLLLTDLTFAQTVSDEPSENSVLQAARDKFNQAMGQAPGQAQGLIAPPPSPEAPAAPMPSASPAVPDAPPAPTQPFLELGISPQSESDEDGESDDEENEDQEAPYTPLFLAFTPGISIPFGYWDSSIALGWIGVLNRDVYGFQGSSVFGIARDVSGFQGAGVFNIARDMGGFQGAGVFNVARNVSGFQGAGVFNIVEERLEGFQGAGVFNIVADAEAPIQGAGVFNIVHGSMRGLQFAGVFNTAKHIRGGQFSSIVNVATSIRGVQIGLINIAEELDGIQIGLVNIAKNGVNGFGALYQPETSYIYGFWQNGTPSLYSLFMAAAPRADWFATQARAIVSFGLGTRIKLGGPYIDIDLSAATDIGPKIQPLWNAAVHHDWIAFAATLPPYPYPSIRALVGIPILGKINAQAGFIFDVDLAGFEAVPSALKKGYTYSANWLGQAFTAYGKWFIGIKI